MSNESKLAIWLQEQENCITVAQYERTYIPWRLGCSALPTLLFTGSIEYHPDVNPCSLIRRGMQGTQAAVKPTNFQLWLRHTPAHATRVCDDTLCDAYREKRVPRLGKLMLPLRGIVRCVSHQSPLEHRLPVKHLALKNQWVLRVTKKLVPENRKRRALSDHRHYSPRHARAHVRTHARARAEEWRDERVHVQG